ncbi:dephospho-CoA kinase [Xylocopilactobacillus apicola]|uniref:Dephospho-CoA kinase n=1 Tax=Xylocopilactobacillus apicola TaxID=2932184 RepID=A0AAU9DWU8_9LACO|nr:dephospho-CoA kinase [Xylocopilactobacillus apicola]BDR58518.1 dephospho-CoA kinase [Xylocopilactobacillus apicola]
MSNSEVVGITGGIGTGKSFVASIIRSLGFMVLDSDQIAHRILTCDQNAIDKLCHFFGEGIVKKDGAIDRKALGTLVFGHPDQLEKLNKILDPFLRQTILAELKSAPKPVFIEIPLLYELHYENYVDQVIVVFADDRIALDRIQKRDHLDFATANKKLCAQLPIKEKIKRTKYIVDTTQSNVLEQVIAILQKIDLMKEDKSEMS